MNSCNSSVSSPKSTKLPILHVLCALVVLAISPVAVIYFSSWFYFPDDGPQGWDRNNRRQIVLAWQYYHDFHGEFPPLVVRDKNGKSLYSWRVALLPFLEQEQLYDQFHHDEPWDSPHNLELVKRMPRIFQDPFAPTNDGRCCYTIVTNAQTMNNIDGILLPGLAQPHYLVRSQLPVIWTKPEPISD